MWSPRSSQSKILKSGKEAFRVRGENVDITILDFWRWAYSDLLDNAARGVLAEFLVANALKQTNTEPRHEWVAIDVRTESGLKVEVKSAAYAQTWVQKAPSKISFDIAPKKQAWHLEKSDPDIFHKPKRVANVYVFCLLGSPHCREPDPMDLNQWEFYVLPTQELPCQKTIGLNRLKDLVQGATPYEELACVIEHLGKGSKLATENT